MEIQIERLVLSFVMFLMAFGFGQSISAGAAQLVTPPVPGPNGMPTQSWFMEGSNNLAQDLANAVKKGKILTIVWEQFGCYYCKLMHEVNFQNHEIVNYVRARFEFVQMDMRGNRVLTNLEGSTTFESRLARKNRVIGTPTIQFLDQNGKEVFRMPGYAKPPLFLTAFEYVAEEAYKTQTLRAYLVEKITDAKATDGFKQTN